jgi:hypothetical protein
LDTDTGGLKAMLTLALPGVITPMVGAPGTVAVWTPDVGVTLTADEEAL